MTVMATVPWNPTWYGALELGVIHNCRVVLNVQAIAGIWISLE
jgi:hypothetical protein